MNSGDINVMLDEHWPEARSRCTELSTRHAVATIACEASDLRPGGFISGPMQFAVADAALWFLAAGATGQAQPHALTSDLNIRFLRPAKGDTIQARAELNKLGGRTLVGSVTVWADDPEEPCAIAQGTYVLPGAP